MACLKRFFLTLVCLFIRVCTLATLGQGSAYKLSKALFHASKGGISMAVCGIRCRRSAAIYGTPIVSTLSPGPPTRVAQCDWRLVLEISFFFGARTLHL